MPRESTLEFVAGSHASRTWYMPRSFFDDRALVFDDGAFEEVPDVDADRGAHTILGWALEPGDDVRFAVRPHATSPPFPELEGVLGQGDVLEHPLFPRLFRRD